ncbi:DJ-1/PfpI family protein [uncultured Microbulbifer sp.]|uniref:DJ-1/PfpI family protein n=1 Tax=uncultured Microbulbifer sp. TaxID=348147 RepID=UPI0026025122|nr:DJ-1/PfpI family protein [uncultured Microbulbifer sp.]
MKKIVCLCMAIFLSFNVYANNGKVLVVVSAADQLILKNGGVVESGYFVSELSETLRQLEDNGYEVDIATPKGKTPVIDGYGLQMYFYKASVVSNWPQYSLYPKAKAQEERSKDITTAMKYFGRLKFTNRYANDEVSAFLDDIEYKMEQQQITEKPLLSLESLAQSKHLKKYDGIYIPGGHAPKTDLLFSKELGNILTYFHEEKKPTAIICHAPIVLLTAMEGTYDPFTPPTEEQKNSFIYKGYNITLGNKSEELILEKFLYLKGSRLEYYVAEKAKEAGLKVNNLRVPSMSQVIEDRELITGANPSSVYTLANRFVAKLNNR